MYSFLVHAHSGLRWIVLLLLLVAIIQAAGSLSGKPYSDGSRKIALFGMIFTHIQILIGLILYFTSPKVQFVEGMMGDSVLRFYAVEHITTMILGAVIITLGYRKAKAAKGSGVFWFYLIGLVIILAGIPWPFRGIGGSWF